jgi:putative DNA primase/helicase
MMSAADIAHALGGASKEGPAWRCRCPIHGGRSFTLCDADGGLVLFKCWAGCDQHDLLAELRTRGLWARGPHRRVPPPRHHESYAPNHARRIARARAIWDASLPAAASPVARYLAGRGIEISPWPASLRWHPRCPRPGGTCTPAMVALVEHVEGGMVGIHRTYITSDHRRHDRASLGPIRGGAVRLGMPRAGERFVVAEGIETALTVAVACGLPAWAALSAGGMRALVLPPEATHVRLCADNDRTGVGQQAARDAAQRFLAEGRHVHIAIPPQTGTDFNDVLLGKSLGPNTEAQHAA